MIEIMKGRWFCGYVIVHLEIMTKHAPSGISYGVIELLHVASLIEVSVRDFSRILNSDFWIKVYYKL